MSKPEISVICSNYNHAQYIERAINSISNQTFENFEIIIVDDGSTDNSKDVIEKLVKTDDRIQKPIYLEKNMGKWFALNTAIEQAKGKLITQQDCLQSGTMILTEFGEKPIEEIKTGEKVLTHKGRFRKVCKTYIKPEKDYELYSVKKQGDNREILMTSNHPLLTIKNKKQEWVKAEDLKPMAHELFYPKIIGGEEKFKITIPFTKRKNRYHTKDREYILDYKFGYICGLYLGGGFATAQGINFSLGEKDFEIRQKLINYIKDIFDLEVKVCKEKDRKAHQVILNNSGLVSWFKDYFQTGSAKKYCNPDIFSWNPVVIRGLLDGYVDSDGSINNRKNKFVKIDSINGKLLSQIKLLATKLNLCFSFFKYSDAHCGYRPDKKRDLYRLSLSGKQLKNFRTSVKTSKLSMKNVKRQYFSEDRNGFRSKSYFRYFKTEVKDRLYNLEIEEDNSYIANGITVHNCDDASVKYRLDRQLRVLKGTETFHSLCGFTHCHNEEDIQRALLWIPEKDNEFDIIKPAEVTQLVLKGYKTPGINHYFMGNDYEVHSATALYYKQLWDHGIRYLPGGLGLRCQLAEDGDFNTKMTLLLQKTSVLKEPLYAYLRHSSTNPAWKEPL